MPGQVGTNCCPAPCQVRMEWNAWRGYTSGSRDSPPLAFLSKHNTALSRSEIQVSSPALMAPCHDVRHHARSGTETTWPAPC
eukprot:gene18582-biopygen21963